jgi:hypothetical protein
MARSDIRTTKDISMNIVLRNVHETQSENVLQKVNDILSHGLKVSVRATKAERKGTPTREVDRVIVATMANQEDKSVVLKNKKVLKNADRFKKVFICSDQSKEERRQANNLRQIVNSLKNGNADKLQVRGTSVFVNRNSGRNENRDTGHREGSVSRERENNRLNSFSGRGNNDRHDSFSGRGAKSYGNNSRGQGVRGNFRGRGSRS